LEKNVAYSQIKVKWAIIIEKKAKKATEKKGKDPRKQALPFKKAL
jgi:hypothetical protein